LFEIKARRHVTKVIHGEFSYNSEAVGTAGRKRTEETPFRKSARAGDFRWQEKRRLLRAGEGTKTVPHGNGRSRQARKTMSYLRINSRWEKKKRGVRDGRRRRKETATRFLSSKIATGAEGKKNQDTAKTD